MVVAPEEIVEYWLASAEHDKETMQVLYDSGRYSDALFFGHIVLEKILKAAVVEKTREQAPYLHDLVRLSELSGILFAEGELGFLDEVNTFNIRARYPDYKLAFYKKATKEYAGGYFPRIKEMYQNICQNLKQQK